MGSPYAPERARKLIGWARRWTRFEAKAIDPQEPSIGRLSEELGEQLEAAMAVIDRLLGEMPTERRCAELERIIAEAYADHQRRRRLEEGR